MFTILPSTLCRQLFGDRLGTDPFPAGPCPRAWRVVASPADLDAQRAGLEAGGMLLYTNIWPLGADAQYVDELATLGGYGSMSLAGCGTFDRQRRRIPYPRKDDVVFPAASVAFVALSPRLLWNRVVRESLGHSVAMAMFALLSQDVSFPQLCTVDDAPFGAAVRARLEEEYRAAQAEFLDAAIAIHNLELAEPMDAAQPSGTQGAR